jgi:hypothetical protein
MRVCQFRHFGTGHVSELISPTGSSFESRKSSSACQIRRAGIVSAQRFFNASSSSRVRGQSEPSRRERLRSARTFPPVWQRAQ